MIPQLSLAWTSLLVGLVLVTPSTAFSIRSSAPSRLSSPSLSPSRIAELVSTKPRRLFTRLDEQTDVATQDESQSIDTVSFETNDKLVNEQLFFKNVEDRLEAELQDLEEVLAQNQLSTSSKEKEDDWRMECVMTKKQDPFLKLVSTQTFSSDPVMKMVSSEVSIKELIKNNRGVKDDETVSMPDSSTLPVDVLIQRTMDTFEDVVVHLRRIPYEKGQSMLTAEQDAARKTIVVLGSGWAAHALMKVADCTKLKIIVVSPSNHFLFTPMLASSAVGTVEYRSMTEAVRAANPLIEDYLEGKATGINVAEKTVNVELNNLLEDFREGSPPTLEIPYDHLIVSVGCKVDDKGVPGADKALRLKTCDDARRLRKAVGECFEYASRPDVAGPEKAEERTQRATFLIVGGGATGIELAGELLDLAADVTRPHKGSYPKLNGNIRVIVAHSGPDLVPQFDEPLRQEALKSLEKKGAKVILNTRVTEVGDGFATLSTKIVDEKTGEATGRDEYNLKTGLTVWCAGTAPVPFVADLLEQLPELARNDDGRIKVDKWMRPPMPHQDLMGSVLVLGDAAAFPEGDDDIAINSLLPQTAQVAGQQGAYAARMLDRGYDLTATPPALPCTEASVMECDVSDNTALNDPWMIRWLEVRGLATAPQFVFLNLGLLAYLGGGEALSQVQVGDLPLFSYFGSVAFILWRSVYLVKQVATRNRVLVTFDWIKSALFGRDMTRF